MGPGLNRIWKQSNGRGSRQILALSSPMLGCWPLAWCHWDDMSIRSIFIYYLFLNRQLPVHKRTGPAKNQAMGEKYRASAEGEQYPSPVDHRTQKRQRKTNKRQSHSTEIKLSTKRISSWIVSLILALSVHNCRPSNWAAVLRHITMVGMVARSFLKTTEFLSNQFVLMISATRMKNPGHLHWWSMSKHRIVISELQLAKSNLVPMVVRLIALHQLSISSMHSLVWICFSTKTTMCSSSLGWSEP